MKHAARVLGAVVVTLLLVVSAAAEQRFPPPDFTSHEIPTMTTPHPDAGWWPAVDVAALVITLSVATWLALVKRSRNGMVALSITALIYFGFYRQGCVCSIGSIQNVSLAAADSAYAIPLSILAFFVLPLLFALLAGRVFCSGVCPLGAVQDLVLLRPMRVPRSLDAGLGLLPYVYLGAAVMLAATETRFLICEFDPFVNFFRFGGERGMLIFGGAMVLLSTVIGRPYCRYLCPYGVLLRHMSPGMRRRFALLLVALPVAMLLGGWFTATLSPHLARLHPQVAAAEAAISNTNVDATASIVEAQTVQNMFRFGGWVLGAFLGLVIVGRMIRLGLYRPQDDYIAERASCYSCARCVPVCPKERERRGEVVVPLDVSAAAKAVAT